VPQGIAFVSNFLNPSVWLHQNDRKGPFVIYGALFLNTSTDPFHGRGLCVEAEISHDHRPRQGHEPP